MIGPILLTAGVLLMVLAAIGLIRLKDPLQRMHAATKAGTLGATLVLIGVKFVVEDVPLSTSILTILFLLFTLPIGAQLLGRATWLSGAKIEGVDRDAIAELRDDQADQA
jgi:multicomponent Na+:H+ antiporter subunit G